MQTVDLLPTVLAALGLPPSDRVHGHDLLPLIRGEQTKVREYACMGMDVEEFAIRTHLWHLIVPIETDPDDPPRPPELYRKPEDRWDQNNVIAIFPEVAEHLELTLRRFVERGGPRRRSTACPAARRCAVRPWGLRPALRLPATASRIRRQTRGRSVGCQGCKTGQTSRFFGTDVGALPPA